MKLALGDAIFNPMIAHIKGFGSFHAYFCGKDVVCGRIVSFDRSPGGLLRMTEFNESLNDDWSRLDDDKEASSSPQSVSDTDDLSWWDDAPQEGSQDRNEIHAFTDEDVLLSPSDDDGSQGASVEVVRGEFKDFEGFILEDNPASDTIKAKIDVFGKPTVVHVRREDVEYL